MPETNGPELPGRVTRALAPTPLSRTEWDGTVTIWSDGERWWVGHPRFDSMILHGLS